MKLERRSQRLVLRPLRGSDYPAWREANSQMLPPQNRWDRKRWPLEEFTRAHFRKVLAAQAKLRKDDDFYECGVFLREGTLIGVVSAMNVVRGVSHTAFLGYVIFNRHWGRGYGKESVRLMFDLAFRDLKLHRLEAGVEPGNRRSILLARSLGMRKEGLKKRMVNLRGGWQDLIIYSITCEELGIRWKGKSVARLR